jgi:hypothetical protein
MSCMIVLDSTAQHKAVQQNTVQRSAVKSEGWIRLTFSTAQRSAVKQRGAQSKAEQGYAARLSVCVGVCNGV